MKKNLISLLIMLPFSYANADDNSNYYYARTLVDLSEYKKVTEDEIPVLVPETSTKLYFVENNYQPLITSEIKNEYDRSAGISEVIQTYNYLNDKINHTLNSVTEIQSNSPVYNQSLSQTIDEFNSDMKNIQDANEKQDTKLEKLGAAALSAEVKINEINETISPVFNEISQLKQDADSIKIQSESVILSVGELYTDISAVQTVNKEQDDQLEELHSENKNIRNNINSLIERAIPADNAIYQLKQDSKKNEQEINNLESAIELTDEVNFSQGNEIQQQGKMISELKAGSDKLTTDLKDVRKKSNTTTNVANANRRDIDKHATKIDKNTLDILKNRQDLRSLENDLRETNERLDNGLAASAALNGLFQPYGVGKLNITAAMGGYQSTQAVAVGTGYRFNENIAVKTGVAYTGSNDVMYNMAFNLEW